MAAGCPARGWQPRIYQGEERRGSRIRCPTRPSGRTRLASRASPLAVPARPSIRPRSATRAVRARREGSVMATPYRTSVNAPARAADWRQTWLDAYPCDMPTTVPYPRAPLTALLETAARRFPDQPPAPSTANPPRSPSSTTRPAGWPAPCIDLGARPGRHVGLLLPNIPEYLVALQAIWLTGATALQLSPLMVAEEVGHWLEATGCHIVVTLDLLAPAVVGSLQQRAAGASDPHVAGPAHGHVARDALPHRAPAPQRLPAPAQRRPPAPLRRPDPGRAAGRSRSTVNPAEDVAVLAPTGGTTASPKAVMLTHRNLLANAMQLRNWCPGGDGEGGVLGVLPFFHSYGLSVSLLTSWAKAATLHLHPRFEAPGGAGPAGGAAAGPRAGGAGHAARAEQGDARPAARPVVHPHGAVRGVGPGAGRAAGIRESRRPATWSRATA